MNYEILSIEEEAFGNQTAPHSRTPAHDLTEMLVAALCAILCGADSWMAIQTWAEPGYPDWGTTLICRREFLLTTPLAGCLRHSIQNTSRPALCAGPRICSPACPARRWRSMARQCVVPTARSNAPFISFRPTVPAWAWYLAKYAKPRNPTRSRPFRYCSLLRCSKGP